MTGYRIMLFLHVLAVVVGLGATFAYPFLQAFAERNGVGATRFMLRFTQRLQRMVVWPGAVVVLVFGIGLTFSDELTYKDDMPVWLTIAIVWYLAAFALDVFVQRRFVADALKTLDGVADSAALPDAYVTLGKRIQMVGGVLGLTVVGIAFLMVWGANDGF